MTGFKFFGAIIPLSFEKPQLIASKKYRAFQVQMMSCNRPVFHLLIELLKRLIRNSTINQMFTSKAVGSKSHASLTSKRFFPHMWSLWKNVAVAVAVDK